MTTTGKRNIYTSIDTTTDTITDTITWNATSTGTAGDIYYADNTTWYHYDSSDKWTTTPTFVPAYPIIPSDGWIDMDTFVPVKCLCCNRMIKDEDNGLHIELSKKTFWFHRRCFADKRNIKFIRSLIVSEDLGLL